jgi:hypothetical protein
VLKVLCALAGTDNVEAAGAGPVDEFHDEGRLVAVSHRVDHAGGFRTLGQGGPCQGVGLDGDHDDVLLRFNGAQCVLHTDDGVARRFNDDVDVDIEEFVSVGHDRGGAVPEGGGDVRGDLGFGPSNEFEGTFGALDVDVRDGDDVDAGDVVRLGQVHGAVPAGADQANPDGAAFLLAVTEKLVKIHGDLSG